MLTERQLNPDLFSPVNLVEWQKTYRFRPPSFAHAWKCLSPNHENAIIRPFFGNRGSTDVAAPNAIICHNRRAPRTLR